MDKKLELGNVPVEMVEAIFGDEAIISDASEANDDLEGLVERATGISLNHYSQQQRVLSDEVVTRSDRGDIFNDIFGEETPQDIFLKSGGPESNCSSDTSVNVCTRKARGEGVPNRAVLGEFDNNWHSAIGKSRSPETTTQCVTEFYRKYFTACEAGNYDLARHYLREMSSC